MTTKTRVQVSELIYELKRLLCSPRLFCSEYILYFHKQISTFVLVYKMHFFLSKQWVHPAHSEYIVNSTKGLISHLLESYQSGM